MLSIFETFTFAGIAVFVITQMIYPAVMGTSLFPLFHTRKRNKQLEAVKRLREDIELQSAIDEILKDLGAMEHLNDDERAHAMKRLKENTDRVEAKVVEATQGDNEVAPKEQK